MTGPLPRADLFSVTVFLHTERHDSSDIDRGIADTLAEVKRLVEAGPAPDPASWASHQAQPPKRGHGRRASRRPSP